MRKTTLALILLAFLLIPYSYTSEGQEWLTDKVVELSQRVAVLLDYISLLEDENTHFWNRIVLLEDYNHQLFLEYKEEKGEKMYYKNYVERIKQKKFDNLRSCSGKDYDYATTPWCLTESMNPLINCSHTLRMKTVRNIVELEYFDVIEFMPLDWNDFVLPESVESDTVLHTLIDFNGTNVITRGENNNVRDTKETPFSMVKAKVACIEGD